MTNFILFIEIFGNDEDENAVSVFGEDAANVLSRVTPFRRWMVALPKQAIENDAEVDVAAYLLVQSVQIGWAILLLYILSTTAEYIMCWNGLLMREFD